jgi:hypothetical protein
MSFQSVALFYGLTDTCGAICVCLSCLWIAAPDFPRDVAKWRKGQAQTLTFIVAFVVAMIVLSVNAASKRVFARSFPGVGTLDTPPYSIVREKQDSGAEVTCTCKNPQQKIITLLTGRLIAEPWCVSYYQTKLRGKSPTSTSTSALTWYELYRLCRPDDTVISSCWQDVLSRFDATLTPAQRQFAMFQEGSLDAYLQVYLSIVAFPVDGICRYFDKATEVAQTQFATSTFFTPQLLTNGLLQKLMEAELTNAVGAYSASIVQLSALLDLNGIMETPITGYGYTAYAQSEPVGAGHNPPPFNQSYVFNTAYNDFVNDPRIDASLRALMTTWTDATGPVPPGSLGAVEVLARLNASASTVAGSIRFQGDGARGGVKRMCSCPLVFCQIYLQKFTMPHPLIFFLLFFQPAKPHILILSICVSVFVCVVDMVVDG